MAVDGSFEATEDARMAAEIARITEDQARHDAVTKANRKPPDPVARVRGQRRRRAKVASASRRRNRK